MDILGLVGQAARGTAGDVISKVGTAYNYVSPFKVADTGFSEAVAGKKMGTSQATPLKGSNEIIRTGERIVGNSDGGDGTVDPLAQQQAAALAAARQGWMGQRDNYLGSINQMINDQTLGLNRGAEDYFLAAQQQQNALNQKGAQNELARIQGRSSILDRVGDQTRSAGVMLGQKNAGNSSAAQALANAYGTLGNRDVQKVEQGYQVNNEGINAEQQMFNQANQVKTRRFEEDKANTINNIINEASAQIQALNNAAAGASIGDRIAIQAEQQRIRNEASARLQSFDAQVAAARGLQGNSVEQRRGEANRLNMAGNAASMFSLTPEQNPQTVQQGNVYDNGLPIYTNIYQKRQLGY